ncbi:MAG: precorrin-2 dehydrogenase/sirohydrochlorin ferrochelatase family protein [Gemmatimonadaceae bacterium]
MSAYPLVLEGRALTAVVAGGGRIATRRAIGLLDAGARVHVVAPVVTPELERAALSNPELRITRAPFAPGHVADAMLVVVATDDPEANALIAAQARALGRLVNAVGAPDQGNCLTPAVHRSGDITVAVTTGRVPTAAARIRDRLGRMLDDRYATAVRELSRLRRDLLNRGERERWSTASTTLVGDEFCEHVESGRFAERLAEWR